MLAEPTCWTRKCKHYIGIIQPDGTEMTEMNSCEAFPKGIPAEIAYGNNRHLKPFPGQDNDVIFEK
jgi:hypothetical protein